ncbi:MAG: MBL fold metallo-hydrolase [candidate division Zixibacteria bacterium]|nr:MBL fold metallo-hydrolase [candidate division Zixibacteria bacterium]
MYEFGDFSIFHFVEQEFKLDGGAMFGVVPKKIWGKMVDVDDENLIRMQTNLFVVNTGDKIFLCDTGIGTILTEKERKIYGTSQESAIESGLAKNGYTADDIDYVFLSHLHTDHVGGAIKEENGKYITRFKNARYLIQKDEWDDATNPNERTGAVYIVERLRALGESGQIDFVEGDKEIVPGVKVVRTGGHTAGHMGIEFSSGGETIVYYADIIPSVHHFKVPYVASVDLFPLDTMKIKRSLTKRAKDGEIAIAFDHDTEIAVGRAFEEGVKTVIKPLY